MELPKEIEWNVIKYMSHPVADLLKQSSEFQEYNETSRFFFRESRHQTFCEYYFEQWMFCNSCDCCAMIWQDCRCCCSRCGDAYKCCKSSCYDLKKRGSCCDLCDNLWQDCDCFCGYCQAEYKYCRMSSNEHLREDYDEDRAREWKQRVRDMFD